MGRMALGSEVYRSLALLPPRVEEVEHMTQSLGIGRGIF